MLRTLLGRKKYKEMSDEHPQAVKYFHKRSILDVWQGSKYAYDLLKHTDAKETLKISIINVIYSQTILISLKSWKNL